MNTVSWVEMLQKAALMKGSYLMIVRRRCDAFTNPVAPLLDRLAALAQGPTKQRAQEQQRSKRAECWEF